MYQCKRDTIRIPRNGALTLARRHKEVEDVLSKQKQNEYSYKELATIFWNLGWCCIFINLYALIWFCNCNWFLCVYF